MCARVCLSWKEFALQAFSRFLTDYNRKYCAFFNQGNVVFEGLSQKIKAYLCSAYWFSEVISDRACFNSRLVN